VTFVGCYLRLGIGCLTDEFLIATRTIGTKMHYMEPRGVDLFVGLYHKHGMRHIRSAPTTALDSAAHCTKV
jgi:hypothetical protein